MMRKVFVWVFNIINNIIPKNNYYIYMLQFMPFKDNISALLDELKTHDSYSKYTITLHDFNLKDYEDANVICVKPYSIRSFWRYWRSKYVFCDNGVYGFIFNKKQSLIYLTHGMTVKKFGYYIPDYFAEREGYGCLPHRAASKVIATGDAFIDVNSKAMGVPTSDILVTGLPRNDYLYLKKPSDLFISMCSMYHKSIIWMPTYRRSDKAGDGVNGADYEMGLPLIDRSNILQFDAFLKRMNIVVVIKRHTLQNKTKEKIEALSNILFIDSDDIIKSKQSLNEFIKDFDALITDYSSIMYDFLLLDRPICNIIDDINEYQGNRGLVFENPEEKMATTVKDYKQLIQFITNVSRGVDPDSRKRQNLDKIFNKYHDNKNSLRVLEQVGIEV